MIYASGRYSTAMLEQLVRGSGRLPPNQHFIEITIPNGVSYEALDEAQLPGWDALAKDVSRAFGHEWHKSQRSLLLIVPSVVARLETNVLINPEHPEFRQVKHGLHKRVWWDSRLFV